MNSENRKSFLAGCLSVLCIVLLINATVTEFLGWEDPNIVLGGKIVSWAVSNISPTFGNITGDTISSNGEIKSSEHQHTPITETQRLQLIEESAITGAVFSYFIEDIDAELEIGLGHIENGIDYRWEILDATATIALITDTFRIAANGKERGISSVIKP